MDSQERKLLSVVNAQIAAFREKRRIFDCLEAVGPEGRTPIMTTFKQPAEIWEPFLRLLAGSRILSLRGEIEYASRLCESPIEEVMLLALALAGEAESDSGVEMQVREPSPFDHICHVLVNPQYVVGKYRVDFRVAAYWTRFDDENLVDEHWCRGEVLVECDGHDFHERTKEQASHDKRKDRDLQAAGFKVFRYTGSDVWNRCMEAATQVVSTAFAAAKESRPLVVRKRRSFKP